MKNLHLLIESFVDMTPERLLAVARAFDRHPNLRPRKVGGDPARIKVDTTMEDLFTKQNLPIDWLTVRRNDKSPNFESGRINFYRGRGGWTRTLHNGEWVYQLFAHSLVQHWGPATAEEDGICDDVIKLFEDLIEAIEPSYACVADKWPKLSLRFKLPGVFWLNYFGAAFVKANPDLVSITNAKLMAPGGILIQTTENPWDKNGLIAIKTRIKLTKILGTQAFTWRKRIPNPKLPTPEDHVASSSGTDEMPWITWQPEKEELTRKRKHIKAQEKLLAVMPKQQEMILEKTAVKWSASMDLPDWPAFAKYLAKELQGDFVMPFSKALIDVVATANTGDEGSVMFGTIHGVVRLDWFIDDETTVDLGIMGSVAIEKLCRAWFESLI